MARTNFSDLQKAELFVRDRATCCFSGRSLWMPDYGVDPMYSADWADHIHPASHGGPSTLENGAAASGLYNKLRGNSKIRFPLFHRGFPSSNHTVHVGSLDSTVGFNLIRFRRLHMSDWFLNRAMLHVLLALTHQHERESGLKRSRGHRYYAGAALKNLNKWRLLSERDSIGSLEKRKLVPRKMELDQFALLRVRECKSQSSIISLMKELYPLYKISADLTEALSLAEGIAQVDRVIKDIKLARKVPKRIKTRLAKYARSLRRIILSHAVIA